MLGWSSAARHSLSKSRTTASAFRDQSIGKSSRSSIASARVWFTIPKAADLDWQLSGISSKRIAGRSSSIALQGRAAGSQCFCRLRDQPTSQQQSHSFPMRPVQEDIALQRILIIEDEEDMVLGLRKNLEWEG